MTPVIVPGRSRGAHWYLDLGELNPCHEPPADSGRNLPSGPRVCRFPQLWRNVLKPGINSDLCESSQIHRGFMQTRCLRKNILILACISVKIGLQWSGERPIPNEEGTESDKARRPRRPACVNDRSPMKRGLKVVSCPQPRRICT